jgi:hypothetical protein
LNICLKRYLKLLIQEFVVRIDQGLILGIISFIKDEKVKFEFEKSICK